ncbi:hypothetical protein PMAYCL1PPCAC_16957, partial [Pristionchus mayeri]
FKHHSPIVLPAESECLLLRAKLHAMHLQLRCVREWIERCVSDHVVLQTTTVVHLDFPHLRSARRLLENTCDPGNLLLLDYVNYSFTSGCPT